ncbi:hypothetical protein CHARACLAT_033072, partial [Characodon lateralis]|nr:hypothetical protein [Characodon lateralis]
VLKVTLNLQQADTYHGFVACTRSIYKHESMSSFYKGFRPSILCKIPYAGVECAVHQFCGFCFWANQQLPAGSDPNTAASSSLQLRFTSSLWCVVRSHQDV